MNEPNNIINRQHAVLHMCGAELLLCSCVMRAGAAAHAQNCAPGTTSLQMAFSRSQSCVGHIQSYSSEFHSHQPSCLPPVLQYVLSARHAV